MITRECGKPKADDRLRLFFRSDQQAASSVTGYWGRKYDTTYAQITILRLYENRLAQTALILANYCCQLT